MTLATEVKKLRDTKAFYAAAGVSDLAVATLRTVPERINRLQQKTDLNDLQTRAKEYAATVSGKATELYDGLAERGRDAVGRTADATQAPVAEVEAGAKTAKRQAKAASTSAKKSTKAAGQAAAETADKAGR
ncbi:MAG: hypothetical protein GEV11_21650 [Streptosporangiales bacterium]|nr:hypothetical protein [Streptosporangiales bacterium]